MRQSDKLNAIQIAKEWIESKPVYLDTETTGLDGDAEICEIAIIDHDGSVLMDQLIKPVRPIPPEASAVHGIRDADVDLAPTFAEILPYLGPILDGREVIIYNAEYDLRLMEQSARAHDQDLHCHLMDFIPRCAMQNYAAFWGDWNDYHQSYRWQKLTSAAEQCLLAIPGETHRAGFDAKMTRLLCRYMANPDGFGWYVFSDPDLDELADIYETARFETLEAAIHYGHFLADQYATGIGVFQRHALVSPAVFGMRNDS